KVIFLDDAGCLKAVQFRHLDVEKDHGKIIIQELGERLPSRRSLHQMILRRSQDSIERKETLGPVIHEKNINLLHLLHPSVRIHLFGYSRPAGTPALL